MDAAVLCETIMLITFGCSWPFNIAKSIKSRTTLGKSVAFEIIIVIGYLFGVAAKLIIYNRTGVLQYSFWFYIIDILLVMTDIVLYVRNYKIDKRGPHIAAAPWRKGERPWLLWNTLHQLTYILAKALPTRPAKC